MSDDGTGDGQKNWGFLCSNTSAALVSGGEERVEPSAKLLIYLCVIQGELRLRATASPHQGESVEVVQASGQNVFRGNPFRGFPTGRRAQEDAESTDGTMSPRERLGLPQSELEDGSAAPTARFHM